MKELAGILILILIRIAVNSSNKRIKYFVSVSMGVVLTCAAVYSWLITEPPAKDSLVFISGEITEVRTRNTYTDDTIFKLDSSLLTFSYINWYPEFSTVVSNLQKGNQAKIWYNPEEIDDEISVWAIEINGRSIVDYQMMQGRRDNNRRVAFVMIFVFGFSTIYLMGCYLRF